jgi:hypothetical protein
MSISTGRVFKQVIALLTISAIGSGHNAWSLDRGVSTMFAID